jgi:hypothetical protein
MELHFAHVVDTGMILLKALGIALLTQKSLQVEAGRVVRLLQSKRGPEHADTRSHEVT